VQVLSRLIDVSAPRDPAAVAVVLHGGASRGDRMHVSPTQLSVLRMIPTARRVARAGRGSLAVVRLLNSYRGWDTHHTPLDDIAWALEEVEHRHPGRPVGLVGHSLGGRAALLAAGAAGVRSVVALNPWLYPEETPARTRADVLIVHGGRDRIAPAARSTVYAQRLAATGARVGRILVPEGKHAMLREGTRFDAYAAEFTAAVLLGDRPSPGSPVGRVRDGEAFVDARD
jgi:alpha-beta hydrolase superfamily lysophospholipase